jgi:hypothetical protein
MTWYVNCDVKIISKPCDSILMNVTLPNVFLLIFILTSVSLMSVIILNVNMSFDECHSAVCSSA